MKTKLKILLILISFFLIIRFSFFFTIIESPYIFGSNTYVGGSKHFFPICITNPIKMYNIKNIIVNYVENTDSIRTNDIFFKQLNNIKDFNIRSVNTNENKSSTKFLIESKYPIDNEIEKCVVSIKKEDNKNIKIFH